MLTGNTFRVTHAGMFFKPIIEQWGIDTLAADLVLPVKNVRRWVDSDSIPAEWFEDVAKAAKRRGVHGVTVASLASIAKAKRLARRSRAGDPQGAAA